MTSTKKYLVTALPQTLKDAAHEAAQQIPDAQPESGWQTSMRHARLLQSGGHHETTLSDIRLELRILADRDPDLYHSSAETALGGLNILLGERNATGLPEPVREFLAEHGDLLEKHRRGLQDLVDGRPTSEMEDRSGRILVGAGGAGHEVF